MNVRMAKDMNNTDELDGDIEGMRGWIGEVACRGFYLHGLANWTYVW